MKHNRVLVFSTDDHLYPAGGAEQAFGNITERLPHITFDLICARLRRHSLRYEEVKNVRIHRIGFGVPRIDGILLALIGQFSAYRLMKKFEYDLVWSIMASYGAFSAVRIKKKKRLPFLLTLQEGDSFEHIYSRVKYVRGLFNEIFNVADGIQAISRYLLSWGKEMGYEKNHGVVIPNGVAIDAFTKQFTDEEIQEKRKSFGFPDTAFVLMTSSRLEKKNGVGDVIKSLALLPSDVCFVICGSGSLDGEIHAMVKQNNLDSRVRFMGFVDPKELPLLMKASDAFIRPSLTEGLGTAFLEAMAAHILVIGTRAGGISDFLENEKTGFVVEIENPKSIAETVQRIMSCDNETKQKILNSAERTIRETYNWDVVTVRMENLFNTLTQ